MSIYMVLVIQIVNILHVVVMVNVLWIILQENYYMYVIVLKVIMVFNVILAKQNMKNIKIYLKK